PHGRLELPRGAVAAGDAGVVDEDVDAPQALHRDGRRGADRGLVGELHLRRLDPAFRLEGLACRLEVARVAVPEHHRRARLEEARGDGVADALRATGDDGDAALEVDRVHALAPARDP